MQDLPAGQNFSQRSYRVLGVFIDAASVKVSAGSWAYTILHYPRTSSSLHEQLQLHHLYTEVEAILK